MSLIKIDQEIIDEIHRKSIQTVSPRQIRQALTRAGMREAVEQAVLAGDQDLNDWWDYSAAFERHHEQVLVMADALGASAQQLDDLWILASEL